MANYEHGREALDVTNNAAEQAEHSADRSHQSTLAHLTNVIMNNYSFGNDGASQAKQPIRRNGPVERIRRGSIR